MTVGLVYETIEMVTLANQTHQIKRMSPTWLMMCDFVLAVLGLVAFLLCEVVRGGWMTENPGQTHWGQMADARWPTKAQWAPWYTWLQLAASILHFSCMIMHCVDSRVYSRRRHSDGMVQNAT
jgi:hypothetical protein